MVDIIQNFTPSGFVDELDLSLIGVFIYGLNDDRFREHLENRLNGLDKLSVFMQQFYHILD
jgi:hypothetical protein